MTALERALELPDDPKRWRGWHFAAGAAALWIVLAVVGARVFALGGFRSPLLVVGALIAVPAMVLAWALAPAEPHRTRIAAAAMAAALVALPLAVHGATPSTARLAQIADGLQLPGNVAHEIRIGSGRCRPACSEIRRVAFVDDAPIAAVEFGVTSALRKRGYAVTVYPHHAGEPERYDAKRGKVLVSVELRMVTDLRTRVATVFLTEGPAPDASVG